MSISTPSILSTISIPLAAVAGTHLDPTWFSNFSYDSSERIREQGECLIQQEKFEYATGLTPVDSNGYGTIYYAVDTRNPEFDFSLIAGKTVVEASQGISVLSGTVRIDVELFWETLWDDTTEVAEALEALGLEEFTRQVTESPWTITADGTLILS